MSRIKIVSRRPWAPTAASVPPAAQAAVWPTTSPVASSPVAPAIPCEGCVRRTGIAEELRRANEDLRRRYDALDEEARGLREQVQRLEREAQGRRSTENLVERLRAEPLPAGGALTTDLAREEGLSIASIPIADV